MDRHVTLPPHDRPYLAARSEDGGGLRPELWIVPLAALFAIHGVTVLQSDPAAVAESRYLGLLTAGVLAALTALGGGRRRAPAGAAGTAFLACAAAWAAYQGPSRGAVVTVLLVLAMSSAAVAAVRRETPVLAPAVTLPAALGFQLLLRGDLLLPPLLDVRTLVSLLALPAVAGGAVSLLATIHGGRRALLAAAAGMVLAPGFNVTTTAGLAAVAAGALLARPQAPRTWRAAAAAVLLLMALWKPPLGILLALTGLTLAGPSRPGGRSVAAWLLPVAALAAAWWGPAAAGWGTAAERWLAALTLLPAVVLAPVAGRSPGESRGPMLRLAHGLVFTFLAARAGAGMDALAAGVALLALAVPEDGPGAGLQRRWSLFLVVGTALLASYPWTRLTPRDDFLDLVGLGVGPPPGTVPAALVAAGALALEALARRRSALGSHQATAIVLLAAALPLLTTAAPTAVLVDSFGAVALRSEDPPWRGPLPAGPVAAVVVDTNLIYGAGLEPGTPVAVVRLRDAAWGRLEAWTLRAGTDTAEWAAARPDVADLPGFRAPPHWLSYLAPEGTFFGRIFRSRFAPERPATASYLTIHRAEELPREVVLMIYRVEVRR